MAVEPLGHWPESGSEELVALVNGFELNFFCRECHNCWHAHSAERRESTH